jgi:hypothetical protein
MKVAGPTASGKQREIMILISDLDCRTAFFAGRMVM